MGSRALHPTLTDLKIRVVNVIDPMVKLRPPAAAYAT
jgi:hypothetical protein